MTLASSIRRLASGARIAVLIVSAVIIIIPIYWVVAASFMPSSEMLSPSLAGSFPLRPTLQNFRALLGTPTYHYATYYLNSLIVAVVTTVLGLAFSAFGGYALGRLRFPGRTLFSNAILLSYIVPGALIIVPIYNIMASLNLVNTRTSVIICDLTFALPFSLWMMRSYFASLPAELEEAAKVDGASVIRAMTDVVFPLAVPGMVAVAMFSFLLSWNDYLFALVFLNSPGVRTLPIGITSTFVATNMQPSNWSDLMAASVLAAVPVFALFLILQKYLVEGLSMGAVKG